jgi:hypothetical protein
MMPRDQTSNSGIASTSFNYSFEAYQQVIICLTEVLYLQPLLIEDPKSDNFHMIPSSDILYKIFPGFKSRWTISFSWIKVSALHSYVKIFSISCSGIILPLNNKTKSNKLPSHSSITIHGTLFLSLIKSTIFTTC